MKLTLWRVAGVTLILGGLTLGGAAAFVFSSTMENAEKQATALKKSDELCQKQLKLLGPVKELGSDLLLEVPYVTDPRTALGDATMALAFCPARSLSEFCLGSGCGDQPSSGTVSMTLRLSAPKTK